MFQAASKQRIVGSLGVLCQRVSDDVVKRFADQCLTDPFHRLVSANDDGNTGDSDEASIILQCEAVLSGLGGVAQLPRDAVSETVRTLTRSALTNIYQLLPAPHQVCLGA